MADRVFGVGRPDVIVRSGTEVVGVGQVAEDLSFEVDVGDASGELHLTVGTIGAAPVMFDVDELDDDEEIIVLFNRGSSNYLA